MRNNKKIPKCPKCGSKKWRRSGIAPTNPSNIKSWRRVTDKRHVKEVYARLYGKKYVCRTCKKAIRYGGKSTIT